MSESHLLAKRQESCIMRRTACDNRLYWSRAFFRAHNRHARTRDLAR